MPPRRQHSASSTTIRHTKHHNADEAPATTTQQIMQLQRQVGNHAVGRLLQRAILDPAYEEDVDDIDIGKRQAAVANMNMTRGKIAANDPRKQTLGAFFGNEANVKGSRSRAAVLPTAASGRRVPTGNQPTTQLPPVLVLGAPSGSAITVDQLTAEQELQQAHDVLPHTDPTDMAGVGPILTAARSKIAQSFAAAGRKKAQGVVGNHDQIALQQSRANIIPGFVRDAKESISKHSWERTVAARNQFIASKGNKPFAEKAVNRAGDDLALAERYYTEIYEVLGFAEPLVANVEQPIKAAEFLTLSAAIDPGQRSAFMAWATADLALFNFAYAHHADLAGVVNPIAVMTIWAAEPVKVTSVANAQSILALTLVGGNVARAISAAKLIGTTAIADLAALQLADGSGQFATLKELKDLVGLGGNVYANKGMKSAGVLDKDITAYNTKAGANAEAAWNTVAAQIGTTEKQARLVKSFVLANDDVTTADLQLMANDDANLADRTTVSSATVGRLVEKGLFRTTGSIYTSGEWGIGSVWVFTYAAGGRIEPEWHIHYRREGKKVNTVGAGWKNAAQKHDKGVKTFTNDALQTSITKVGKWKQPNI